ncbi:hypothetical protein RJ640_024933 [Escallonia rubra]|uniref:Uncharacterized protein n=1 Tax=Escallonia rubra TaxID=112253 RepID=A0AA88UPX7_9ASTE|nr:hypothetical protein RJ640_024933 [Escallonia rubra]
MPIIDNDEDGRRLMTYRTEKMLNSSRVADNTPRLARRPEKRKVETSLGGEMDESYKDLVEQPNARPPTSNISGGQGKGQVEGSVSDGSRQGSVSSSSKTKHEDSKAREVFKETQRVSVDSMGNIPDDGHSWRSHDDEPSEITEDSKGYSREPPVTRMLRSKRKRMGYVKNLVSGEASHDQKGKENKEASESILKEWRYSEPISLTWSDLSREEVELLASEMTQKAREGKHLYQSEMRFMEYYRLLGCKTLPPGTEAEGMKEVKEEIRALRLEAEALSRRKDVLHLLSSYSMKPEVAIDVFTLTSIFSRINGCMRDLFVHSGENNGPVDYITCRNIISRRIPELFWDVKALLAEAAFDTVPYLAEGMVQNMNEPRLWPDGEFPAPQPMYTLASDSAIRQAMKCIQERTFRSIGISGIGGKEVAKALTNLPEIRSTFSVVLLVSISQHLSIGDVESQIKQQIHAWKKRTKGIDIYVPLNVPCYNCLLLLDCIDEPINLYALDIPGPSKTGFRFHVQTVLTTQSQKAYHVMPVDLEIRMEDHLLPWDVFCKNLGHASTVDFSSLKPMAVRLVEECRGHLLAIILLARALNGVKDSGIWELALHELTTEPSSEIEGISKDMVNVLRFIWQRKGNASKHCIKYCTSHDKGTVFLRDSLISGWIRAGSVKTQEEGDDILKDLISSFLLEEVGETSVRMREETRLVLLNRFILRPHPVYLMQGSAGLTEAPELKEWDAEEIHLMNNKLSEVPEKRAITLQLILVEVSSRPQRLEIRAILRC